MLEEINFMSGDSAPITGGQIRAARAFLRWSAEELAQRSRIGVATIRRSEAVNGTPPMTAANNLAVRRALENAGVVFFTGAGNEPGLYFLSIAKTA